MSKIINGFIALLFFFSCASSGQSETIRFGVMYNYLPFVAVNQTGQTYGLDVDIAKALCQQANKSCMFVPMSFADLFIALDNGTIDAAMSAIIISKARQENYDFVPYYSGQMGFLTMIGTNVNTSPQGLKGKKVGTLKRTAYVNWLKANYPDSKVLGYDLSAEAIEALSQGYVDVFLTDYLHAKWWVLNGNNQYKMASSPMPLPDNQSYGIAIKKGNIAMLTLLNQAMQAIIANGIQTRILNTYSTFQP